MRGLGGAHGAAFPPAIPGQAGVVPSVEWEKAFVTKVLELVRRAKRREEDPSWSVRERLSARAGRMHLMRLVRKAAKQSAVSAQRRPRIGLGGRNGSTR